MRLAGCKGEGYWAAVPIRDHASLGAVAAAGLAERLTPIALLAPISVPSGPSGLVVRKDAGAVKEDHTQRDPAPLSEFEQPLPDAEAGPSDEGLRRSPRRSEFCRDAPPLCSILVPPDDRLDRPA
jgi:hypothetical protein